MSQTKAEPISTTRAELGEGPTWDGSRGELVWVDILGRRVHRTDATTGSTATTETPSEPGAAVQSGTGWVVSLPNGVHSMDSWQIHATFPVTEPPSRANDGKADPWGNLVQGTMGWNAEPGAGALYRLNADRGLETLLSGLTISNGLDWTDDGKSMFHIDTPTRRIMRFPYDPDGPLGPGTVAIDLADLDGVPDGMCLDSEGYLWVAFWGAGAVRRFSPGGTMIRQIDVPTGNVTSCSFGGPDLDTLFITTAASDDGVDDLGGRLFVADPAATGRPSNILGEVT